MISDTITQAIITLKTGGIIAYPTEAVYGLGCDPFNEQAVLKLLTLKHRDRKKGLILITATWKQVQKLTQKIPASRLKEILQISKYPITWVFPASKSVPLWICGEHSTIALRITTHPIAKNICAQFGSPIVSTSANLEGKTPANNKIDVFNQFPQGIDLIVDGETGSYKNPSEIRDVITGKILRPG